MKNGEISYIYIVAVNKQRDGCWRIYGGESGCIAFRPIQTKRRDYGMVLEARD